MDLVVLKIRCLELAANIGRVRTLTTNEMVQLAEQYYKFITDDKEESDLLTELHEPLSVDTRY